MSLDRPNKTGRYLLIKHSEGWSEDRCSLWMQAKGYQIDLCYPVSGQAFPDPSLYQGVVIFGGAPSANDTDQFEWARQELQFIEQCLKTNTPFFGVCLGAQMLARVLGAEVTLHPDELTEVGFFDVDPLPGHSQFMSDTLTVMQWHKEGFDLPAGTTLLASSERFPNQAFSYGALSYGVQFHPEVNPATLDVWHERNRQRDTGALSEEERIIQRRDALTHDANITRWFDGFLTHWHKLSDDSRMANG